MAVLVLRLSADTFEAIFANRQRAVALLPEPLVRPDNLVEITDDKRRCQRFITHVTDTGIPDFTPLVLVSLRPLTSAEKLARMTGEGEA